MTTTKLIFEGGAAAHFAGLAEDARDAAIAAAASGPVTALTIGGSTANAMLATTILALGLTGYVDYREYTVRIDSTHPAVNAAFTLKIDNGPVLGVYNQLNGYLGGEVLKAIKGSAWITVRKMPNFGGLFQLVSVLPVEEVVRCIDTSGTANAITVVTPSGLNNVYSDGKIYSIQLSSDPTIVTPTLSIDGGPALGIYDSSANLLPLGHLRKYRRLLLHWSSQWNVWTLLERPEPAGSADTYRAMQAASATAAGVRDLYRQVNPAPVAWTTHYLNQFNSQADCNTVKTAYGTTPADYISTVYNASSGGFANIDCAANGGLWRDGNHIFPGPGELNLLGIFYTVTAGGSIPNISDLRNARVTMKLKANNLKLPRFSRLALHFQVNDTSVGAGGTGKALNYIHAGKLIDDALGFGGEGLAFPHMRDTPLTNAAPVDVVFDLAPNDAFWQCLFSSISRKDTYAAAPVVRALQQPLLDFILVALHPQQDEAASAHLEPITGELELHEFKIEIPA